MKIDYTTLFTILIFPLIFFLLIYLLVPTLFMISFSLNTQIIDSDGDRLPDSVEEIYGTDVFYTDTDHDGIPDYWEIKYNLDPLNPLDAELDQDNDGYTSLEEYNLSLNEYSQDPFKNEREDTGFWFDLLAPWILSFLVLKAMFAYASLPGKLDDVKEF